MPSVAGVVESREVEREEESDDVGGQLIDWVCSIGQGSMSDASVATGSRRGDKETWDSVVKVDGWGEE